MTNRFEFILKRAYSLQSRYIFGGGTIAIISRDEGGWRGSGKTLITDMMLNMGREVQLHTPRNGR